MYKKTRIKWFTNNMSVVHSKTLFQYSNIFKNGFRRLSFLSNENLSLFIEKKSQTSHWGLVQSSSGSTGSLVISI